MTPTHRADPMSALPQQDFFDAWDTYAKVVAGDYMFHSEIGAALNRALRARFEGRRFSMLDLGCGDAATLSPVLEGLTLSCYKGVDLSQTALAIARENLRTLACPVELTNAHLLDGFSEDAVHDAIYTSFALHHLPTAQKADFFRLAAQRLAQGGVLLLVDVVREEDETLDVYHRRYCDWLRGNWNGLTPREREFVCDHLVNNDRPEPFSVLEAQARAAGLAVAAGGARRGWHRLMCFAQA